MLQNSLSAARRNDDDDDDDREGESYSKNNSSVAQLHIGQNGLRCPPWVKHVDGTKPHDTGSTNTSWMATLLQSLHFRLIDHKDLSPSHLRRPPPQCLVYMLDSDLQPAPLTSASGLKHETGSGRSASVDDQSQGVVESPTLRTLPFLTSSSSSSWTTVNNSHQRQNPRDQCDVTSAGTTPPLIAPKPNCMQSPPLAARYPLRRKILSTGSTSRSTVMTSSVSRGVDDPTCPPTKTGPPPPPLPARRGKLPPTPRFRTHLGPPTSSPTEPPSVLPVQQSAGSADEQQHVSETTHEDNEDDDNELNYKVASKLVLLASKQCTMTIINTEDFMRC